ncbi:MAG TPA: hypothetical protein VFG83_03110 [Kofleriaceae bacterium]|nr:hypothetical protein [Kofleriaceae bacterium]
MPVAFDRDRIERFLDRAAASLEGEWLLVGGAAAAVWFKAGRITEDIDLIGFAGTSAERMQLMELASVEGIPIEAVNSAADFFVYRIPDWKAHIEVLRRGPCAMIYRPSPTLFLLLKIGRLSEQDLEDCLALLEVVERDKLVLDRERLIEALGALPAADHPLCERRDRLVAAISSGQAHRTPPG